MNTGKKIKEDLQTQTVNEQPKIIAEIHIAQQPSYREQFLYEYHNCCLCGTELSFTHVTHFAQQQVIEEAYCYSCNIRNKKEEHKLQ